jgi:hypothetical protein
MYKWRDVWGGGGHYEGLVRLVHALWSSMYKWRDVWGGGGGSFRIRTVFNFMQTNLECGLSEAVSREVFV